MINQILHDLTKIKSDTISDSTKIYLSPRTAKIFNITEAPYKQNVYGTVNGYNIPIIINSECSGIEIK